MKTINCSHINLTFIVKYSTIVFVALMLFSCTAMKVLTASYTLIDTNNVSSLKIGITTRDEVLDIMGEPDKELKNEYVFLYIDIHANRDNPYIQETHVYFDDSNVIKKTTYINMTKGGDESDPLTILDRLSSLEIGKYTFTQVQDIIYPTVYLDYYENGSLKHKQFQYRTSEAWYKPLGDLPYVTTTSHEKGETYSLFFTSEGILKTPDL